MIYEVRDFEYFTSKSFLVLYHVRHMLKWMNVTGVFFFFFVSFHMRNKKMS